MRPTEGPYEIQRDSGKIEIFRAGEAGAFRPLAHVYRGGQCYGKPYTIPEAEANAEQFRAAPEMQSLLYWVEVAAEGSGWDEAPEDAEITVTLTAKGLREIHELLAKIDPDGLVPVKPKSEGLVGALKKSVQNIEQLAGIVNTLSPGKVRAEDFTEPAKEALKKINP